MTLRDARRRFFANRLAVVGLAMVMVVCLTALLAPLLAPYDPLRQDTSAIHQGPSRRHLMGTDEVGRDQLSRIVYGSRVAITVGLAAVGLALVIGVVLGSLAGYLGRGWDTVIMRTADAFFAFPLLVGAVVVIAVLGRGVSAVVLALAVFSWATVARLLRSSMLAIREAGYVEAARSLGAGRRHIVLRHVLPNSLAPLIAYAAVGVGTAVVAEASLSFLGLGVGVEAADWGNMLARAQPYVGTKDFLWVFPGLAVVFTVLGFVLAGDGLRDALDPRVRNGWR